MGVVKRKGDTFGAASYWFISFSFHMNQTNNCWDTAMLKFVLENSKVKVMSEVKGQGHIAYPVANQCTSFSFHINRNNHSWDMANSFCAGGGGPVDMAAERNWKHKVTPDLIIPTCLRNNGREALISSHFLTFLGHQRERKLGRCHPNSINYWRLSIKLHEKFRNDMIYFPVNTWKFLTRCGLVTPCGNIDLGWPCPQCSAKALETWGQMTHTFEKYGDIGNFSGVTFVILPFVNLKFVGTLAPTAKISRDIPDFNVLNVPKTQPWHNPVPILSPRLHSGSNIISDSHPFCSKSIDLLIPEIWLIDNFTLKVQVQVHVHR